MSFQAMTWAAVQRTGSPSQKLVLLMLANHQNFHTGQCNPSHKRLAEECDMSISTVKRALSDLEKGGFLKIKNKIKNKIKQSNDYKLLIHNEVKLSEGVVSNCTEGRVKLNQGVGSNRPIKQEVETRNETRVVKGIPENIRKQIDSILKKKLPQ
jgi:DNA-binding transcriptional regulator YhcF (GntR family)